MGFLFIDVTLDEGKLRLDTLFVLELAFCSSGALADSIESLAEEIERVKAIQFVPRDSFFSTSCSRGQIPFQVSCADVR